MTKWEQVCRHLGARGRARGAAYRRILERVVADHLSDGIIGKSEEEEGPVSHREGEERRAKQRRGSLAPRRL